MSSKYNNYNSSVVTVGVAETALLERNNARTALLMFNQGSNDVQFYFEDNATMFFTIAAGEGIHLPSAPQNEINAVTVSGTSDLTIMEG